MLKNTQYSCGICKSKPDQLSHHKSHVATEKHKDKKELFELKLSKLTDEVLLRQYNSNDINAIVETNEMVIHKSTKKLNNIDNLDIDLDINIIKNMEECTIISNKEALRDKIHEIHNFLRNNGAGYGMNALKVFNILYGLKKIEENKLLDKIKLKKPDCKFSYLLQLANQGDDTDEDDDIDNDEQLAELIYGSILDSISNSKIRDLLFYEIPKNMKGSSFAYLIKEIDKITQIEKKCNVLLSGKIYEYFIGRDESAISELGAYFTDRHIVNYIYDKIQPDINDDKRIKSMIDMFGGSGGFTTGYIDYLLKSYPKEIDWSTEINKIHHYDINEDVIKSAGLEFFCLTGQIPNMKTNLGYRNSFTNEFDNKRYDLVITNPPYGGDKVKQSDSQIKRKKVADYIKEELKILQDQEEIKHHKMQLKAIEILDKQEKKDSDKTKVTVGSCSVRIQKYAKINKLSGNDKESSSLILMMDMVKEEGTCVGVLKEGVFFNKTYKELRRCLINNFNVKEVISVPQDQFENTSTKTSIVIFDNTKQKTVKIKFSKLIVERYDTDKFKKVNNNIVIIENKGDIKKISDKLISVASLDELNKNPIYSLNGKDYNKKVIVCGKDYELKKLGDICELESGKQLDKSKIVTGIYPVYGGGSTIIGYHNQFNRENCTIISGTGNYSGFVQYDSGKLWASQCFTLKSKNDLINQWLFYYCKSQQDHFMNSQEGSAQKFIRASQFKDMLISMPKSLKKMTEWVTKISKPYNEKNTKQMRIQELEIMIKDKIINIMENEDCNEIELKDVVDKKNNALFNINTNEMDNNGPYHFYNKIGNHIGFHSKYNYDIEQGILITKDGGSGFGIYGDNIALGGVMLIKGKFASTYANFVLTIHKKYNIRYIYYLLKLNKNHIMDLANYSVKIGHIQYDKLMKIKIQIPKNKKLITELEPLFKEIEQLQNEVKKAELLYNQYIKELGEEAILTNSQIENKPSINQTNKTVREVIQELLPKK